MVQGMRKGTVIIPTYNEVENIGLLIDGITSLNIGLDILVVDDNSPDGTGELVAQLMKEHTGLSVIQRPGKLGLGTAHIAGIQAALASEAQYILTMDADFSHHPRYLPDLVVALAQADVVIGSRYAPGGGVRHCTAPRKALSHGANLFARTVLGLEAEDATAGFRGYRRDVVASIPLDTIRSNGYSFLIEMLYLCQLQGWRIREVPIVFENRQRGASKISRAEILRALQTVVRLGWVRLSRQWQKASTVG
jgi:dolichol-phosphate mannosyltransferase